MLKLSWMMFLLKLILALVMFSFLFANQFLRSYFRILTKVNHRLLRENQMTYSFVVTN